MRTTIFYRAIYAIVGATLAFALYQLNVPVSDRTKMWLMVAYLIIGIIITEILIAKKRGRERAR